MAIITKHLNFEKQQSRWTELHNLLSTMDVPELRYDDVNWLLRNLPINNGNHPQYARAYELCKEIKKEISKAIAAML
ncbi:MAG TPA: hypothetical protein VIJ87_11240 [Pyrinomonadaceae bacterium]